MLVAVRASRRILPFPSSSSSSLSEPMVNFGRERFDREEVVVVDDDAEDQYEGRIPRRRRRSSSAISLRATISKSSPLSTFRPLRDRCWWDFSLPRLPSQSRFSSTSPSPATSPTSPRPLHRLSIPSLALAISPSKPSTPPRLAASADTLFLTSAASKPSANLAVASLVRRRSLRMTHQPMNATAARRRRTRRTMRTME